MLLYSFLLYFSWYIFASQLEPKNTEVELLRYCDWSSKGCNTMQDQWRTPETRTILAPGGQKIFSITVNSTHWAKLDEHPGFDVSLQGSPNVTKLTVYINNKPSISDHLVEHTFTSPDYDQYTWCDMEEDTYYLIFVNEDESLASFDWRVDLENPLFGCDGEDLAIFGDLLFMFFIILMVLGIACCICIALAMGCPIVLCCCACFNHQMQKQQQQKRQNQFTTNSTEMTVPPNEGVQKCGTSNQISQQGLPPNWEELWDAATQKKYWVNHIEKRSQWEDPRSTGSAGVAIPVCTPPSAPLHEV